MPVTLEPEEYEFLARVEELGREGKTHDEIAAVFNLTRTGLYYRLGKLGYAADSVTRLRSVVFKKPFTELLASGEVVVNGREPVGVA